MKQHFHQMPVCRIVLLMAMILPLSLAGRAPSDCGRALLSSEGSGRATAYLESPKIVSFHGKTHVAWLDSSGEGFRVRIRTLDTKSGKWSDTHTIGEATDNHGGPALTIDKDGYLHVLYYSHHHPFRYRRSLRPNDASAWTPYEEFGQDLTYPALLCARDGTLLMTARRSYEKRPWELEFWSRMPGKQWERRGALLRSRHGNYAQFAASLAWGPDHTTLHLSTRIYEMPDEERLAPLTTVGYMVSPDGGGTWTRLDGQPIDLPATADSLDVIASGRAIESRILNAGSLAVSPNGVPNVPYSVRVQDSSQAYLATPKEGGGWRHLLLNSFLPAACRDWDLFMHGGIAFGMSGQPVILATIMEVAVDGIDWGDTSTELVRFCSKDGGQTFTGDLLDEPDPASPRWMPNIERPTGFNEMPAYPGFIYTDGVRGDSLEDQLSNRVWWVPGKGT